MIDLIEQSIGTIRTAKKHRQPLVGDGFYARKFFEVEVALRKETAQLSHLMNGSDNSILNEAVQSILSDTEEMFSSVSKPDMRLAAAARIKRTYLITVLPNINPSTHAPSDDLIPLSLVKGTRGYIERIAHQASGAYDQGWYDACAVMCRRLLETLIIEAFESKAISPKIQDASGNYKYLSGLIPATLSESAWTLSRNARKALPNLKDIGDLSAHSRRFTAQKGDIDPLRQDFRIAVEEFLHISGLR